jgi:uncharacterized LabA/DUF88 family protein
MILISTLVVVTSPAPSELRLWGFFMNQVCFLVDGFNLYHSIEDIASDNNGLCLKWLDIHALCSSFLYLIGNDSQIKKIYYFTALAYHLNNQSVIDRHENYIRCLEHYGIETIRGTFKEKHVRCKLCQGDFIKHEEKETDVSISIKILELLYEKYCSSIVIISGNTDIAPAVKFAKQKYPDIDIRFAFPYKRKNDELVSLAPNSFKIKKVKYVNYQLPNPVTLSDGVTQLHKPLSW